MVVPYERLLVFQAQVGRPPYNVDKVGSSLAHSCVGDVKTIVGLRIADPQLVLQPSNTICRQAEEVSKYQDLAAPSSWPPLRVVIRTQP